MNSKQSGTKLGAWFARQHAETRLAALGATLALAGAVLMLAVTQIADTWGMWNPSKPWWAVAGVGAAGGGMLWIGAAAMTGRGRTLALALMSIGLGTTGSYPYHATPEVAGVGIATLALLGFQCTTARAWPGATTDPVWVSYMAIGAAASAAVWTAGSGLGWTTIGLGASGLAMLVCGWLATQWQHMPRAAVGAAIATAGFAYCALTGG